MQPVTSAAPSRQQLLGALAHVPGVVSLNDQPQQDKLTINSFNDQTQLYLQTLLRPTIAGENVDVRTRNFVILRHPATEANLLDSLQHFPGVVSANLAPLPFNPTANPAFVVHVDSEQSASVLKALIKDHVPVTDDSFQPQPKPWDMMYVVNS